MTTILIKKKDTAGAPAAGDLTNAAGGAEIAVNTATKRVYSKDSGGTVIEMGTFPSTMAVQGALSATGNVTLGDAAADNVTVNGTITSNLIFTDATYDIGASGANRPRDLFLSRNLTVGGTLTLAGGVNLNGNVTVGDSSADTLTINSTITSNLIFTDNTYDIGASGATRPRSLYLGSNMSAAGTVGIGTLATSDVSLRVNRTATGDSQYGILNATTYGGTGTNVYGILNQANIAASASFSAYSGFLAVQPAYGAGATVTSQTGFSADSTLTGATNNFGFNSNIAAGTGRWNFYASGTAQNYFNGNVGIGSGTTVPQSQLHIGNVGASGIATARLQGNLGVDGQVAVLNFSNRTDITGGYIIGAISVNRTGDDNSGSMIFSTANAASTPTECARFSPTGNFGVGTNNPSVRLDVVGDVNFSDPVQVTQLISSSTTAGNQPTLSFQHAGNNTFSLKGGSDLKFYADGTTNLRATLDNAGNFGLGNFTPSNNWGNSYIALQVSNVARSLAATGAGSGDLTLVFNAIYDVTDSRWEYAGTGDAAARYAQTGAGTHTWYSAPVGTVGNATNFYETMSVDINGRLALTASSGNNTSIQLNGSSASCTNYRINMGVDGISNGGFSLRNTTSSTTTFAISPEGRATIGSNMSPSYSATLTLQSPGNSYNLTCSRLGGGTGSTGQVVFENDNGAVGSIFTSGSTTAYNTSSDYRLKNAIAPMTGALDRVMQLNPVTYKWNADGADGEGFIAHELAEVVPQAVTGEKDAVDADGKPQYQGIDVSFLVATLTAAIQELKAEFDIYKASHP
jgi:hypothetical protein